MQTFDEVKLKIKNLENELADAKVILKIICPHNNIKHSEGYKEMFPWADWYKCEDCTLYGDGGQTDKTNYNILKSKYK
jgi:hypothetical protein